MTAILLAWLLAAAPAPPDTVVVCPADYREALQPWWDLRTRQGHTLTLVGNTGTPDDIRRAIREAARGGKLRTVVLVGGAAPHGAASLSAAAWTHCVPTHRAEAKINVLWGSEPHLATDNWYADLDDDQKPDLAVGRLTADSADELRRVVAKTVAYENSKDFGPWRRQVNFVAGIGGFGPVADMVLESATRYFLTEGIPAAYRTSMTYGSWRSAYCPDPRLFHATTLQRLNEGSWFWVYIGHGQPFGLDRISVPGQTYPIMDVGDMAALKCEHAGPIALFLSCYAGAIDARQHCLAEELLRTEGGPIAVLAGSRVTMPYAMGVLATGLMEECFRRDTKTIGEAVLNAKLNMLREPKRNDQQRATLDAIAKAISPAPKELAAERAEHVLLFNLLGDPLLTLRRPRVIDLDVPENAAAGKPLRVSGRCAIDGAATLELIVPRGQLTFPPPNRDQYPQTSSDLAQFQETYRRANDVRLATAAVVVRQGRFETRLDVPAKADGPCHVCAFVEGDGDFALGAKEVNVSSDGE